MYIYVYEYIYIYIIVYKYMCIIVCTYIYMRGFHVAYYGKMPFRKSQLQPFLTSA